MREIIIMKKYAKERWNFRARDVFECMCTGLVILLCMVWGTLLVVSCIGISVVAKIFTLFQSEEV